MTTAQKKWIRMIHVAKSKTGIDDEAYRAILAGTAGVSSSCELRNWSQYHAVMAAFRVLGFKPEHGKETVAPQEIRASDRITAGQEAYIRGLWKLASRSKDEKSLRQMVRRITGVADVTWCSKADAGKVILALRTIAGQAGFNPDGWEK